jgi:23S rRNA (pseudouridine1915-N3)-methyltransferase
MLIKLVAVGSRMPAWVEEGYKEYARRLPRECVLRLTEIPPAKRTRSTSGVRAREAEGNLILKAINNSDHVIALDVKGKAWDTEQLSGLMRDWMQSGQDVVLMVGGPDGLSDECLARADRHWSLSALTFPHALVRVVLAEQLYRSWTILTGHPYHRS